MLASIVPSTSYPYCLTGPEAAKVVGKGLPERPMKCTFHDAAGGCVEACGEVYVSPCEALGVDWEAMATQHEWPPGSGFTLPAIERGWGHTCACNIMFRHHSHVYWSNLHWLTSQRLDRWVAAGSYYWPVDLPPLYKDCSLYPLGWAHFIGVNQALQASGEINASEWGSHIAQRVQHIEYTLKNPDQCHGGFGLGMYARFNVVPVLD